MKKRENEKIRAFLSIDIPKTFQKKIQKIQKDLPGFSGKLIEPENLHLTLKFLGEIDTETIIEIKQRLEKIKFKKFPVKISHLGVFSKKQIKIIWLKMENCSGLQRVIDENLSGLFEQEERFMGHLTIARVYSVRNKKYFLGELKKIELPLDLKFSVWEFLLKKSTLKPEGPVYEDLEVFHSS